MYDVVNLLKDQKADNNFNRNDHNKNNIVNNCRPYMHEAFNRQTINKVLFVPLEDLCGIGFGNSYRHCIIPGSGAANFDSWNANPFQTSKQRQEAAVKGLLEKLPADMITVDNHVFNVMRKEDAVQKHNESTKTWHDGFKHEVDQNKNRARDKYGKRLIRKNNPKEKQLQEKQNEAAHRELDAAIEKKQKKEEMMKRKREEDPKFVPSALDRFF